MHSVNLYMEHSKLIVYSKLGDSVYFHWQSNLVSATYVIEQKSITRVILHM